MCGGEIGLVAGYARFRIGVRTIRLRKEDVAALPKLAGRGSDGAVRSDYDPDKALAALQSMRGIFKDIDTEQLKKDIREARGHHNERGEPDIWAEYDAQKVRETLRRGFGILRGIDIEQMKKDIRKGRAQDSKGRPA